MRKRIAHWLGCLALLTSWYVSAQEPPAAAEPVAGASQVLDPDDYFSGKTGGTFGKDVVEVLPLNKRVGVAGFRVIFVTENSVKAQVRASYFGGKDTSGASAKMDVALAGVDYATMQAVADKAYARFLEQLQAAGREVVPQTELQAFLDQVEATATSSEAPYTQEVNLGHARQVGFGVSPAGMPLWFTNWDAPWGDKGAFSQHNIRTMADTSAALDAILVAPLIVVDFAQMSTSGNRSGFLAREAEVGATLSMSVSMFSTPVTRAEETRKGIVMKGDDAAVTLKQPVVSEIGFATMATVSEEDNKSSKGMLDGIGKSLGLANLGGSAKSKSAHQAQTNGDAYTEAALDALGKATGTFAAWFAKYPAQ